MLFLYNLKMLLYLNLLFTYLFGETSAFNEKVISHKMAIDFYIDHLTFDNIYVLNIEAESEFADIFKDEVDKATSNINISEEDFERIKKTWLSIIIRSLDNKENLASSIIEDIIKDNEMTDQLELINKLKYQDLIKMINKLDLTNKTFIIMMKKENR